MDGVSVIMNKNKDKYTLVDIYMEKHKKDGCELTSSYLYKPKMHRSVCAKIDFSLARINFLVNPLT